MIGVTIRFLYAKKRAQGSIAERFNGIKPKGICYELNRCSSFESNLDKDKYNLQINPKQILFPYSLHTPNYKQDLSTKQISVTIIIITLIY